MSVPIPESVAISSELTPELTPERTAELEAVLVEERRSLLSELDGAAPVDEDAADDPGALLAARSELSALAQQASERLALIDRALERMVDGSYGTCVVCEQEIPFERLEIVPAAVSCVSCQEQGVS